MNDAEHTTGRQTGTRRADGASDVRGPNVRRRMAAAGLVLGLVAGVAGGMILGTPSFVSAEEDTADPSTITTIPDTDTGTTVDVDEKDAADTDGVTTTTKDPGVDLPTTTTPDEKSDSGAAPTPDGTDPPGASKHLDRMKDRLDRTLKVLVDNGTITREQADAVIRALTDAHNGTWGNRTDGAKRRSSGWMTGRGHAGGPAAMFRGMKEIYDAIGLEPQEIFEQLRDGRTIVQIAEDHGVTRQNLIDAVVDPLVERLDTAVTDGRMTRQQADEMVSRTTEAITKVIDGEMPSGWNGPGRHRSGGNDDRSDGDADPGD